MFRQILRFTTACMTLLALFLAPPTFAEEASSTSFIGSNQTTSDVGGVSTSTSFILISSGGELSSTDSSSDNLKLQSGPLHYGSLALVSRDWRWFDDAENTTPVSPMAATSTAPSSVEHNAVIKLRILVAENGGAEIQNAKFRLQFSESSDFSDAEFVEEIGACTDGVSLWCYDDGGGNDNDTIPSTVITGADGCPDGCGTHNESGVSTSTFTHAADAVTEYEFTVKHAGARPNTTYFFRLYDASVGAPVLDEDGGSAGYPSLATEGSSLTFNISGLPVGTETEGITTAVETFSTAVPFGSLPIGQKTPAAQRMTISTDAASGYSIFAYQRQGLVSTVGAEIDPVAGTNENPAAWDDGCVSGQAGCYGYHTSDGVLSGDNATRFSATDTYARFVETPEEVAFSSGPSENAETDIVYTVEARDLQEAGAYQSSVVYIVVTRF